MLIYPVSKPKLLDVFKLLLASLTYVSMVQPLLRLLCHILQSIILLSYAEQVISVLTLHCVFSNNPINTSPGSPRKFIRVGLLKRSCSKDHVVIVRLLFWGSLDCGCLLVFSRSSWHVLTFCIRPIHTVLRTYSMLTVVVSELLRRAVLTAFYQCSGAHKPVNKGLNPVNSALLHHVLESC